MKTTIIYKFYEQVKQEAKKISWPEKRELATSVVVVMVAVAIFSVACLIMDYGIHSFIQFLLSIGK
jgi:preprotein translocase subunit SecE